jgi:hypothetical protein
MRNVGWSLIASALLLAGQASAQSLIGRALDEQTNGGLAAADISLIDRSGGVRARAITDSAGWFRLSAPAPGQYTVQAATLGYATSTSTSIQVAHGIELHIEIRLSSRAVPLEPLRVVAERRLRVGLLAQYYDRAQWSRNTGLGRVYMRDDIERMHLTRVQNLLAQNPPRAGCAMTYMLDGLTMSRDDIDRSIMPEDVEGVEIYRAKHQVPVEYWGRTTCGLVLVWTRNDRVGVPWTWKRALIFGTIVGGAILLLQR